MPLTLKCWYRAVKLRTCPDLEPHTAFGSDWKVCEPGSTWMVKTMPTKDAVSSDTPRLLGPTSLSCSMVLALWNLPACQVENFNPS